MPSKSLSMPVRFACPACQQRLSVSSRKVGSEVTCPKCARSIRVPEADDSGQPAAASHPATGSLTTGSLTTGQSKAGPSKTFEVPHIHPQATPSKPAAANPSLSQIIVYDDVAAVLGAAPAALPVVRDAKSSTTPEVDRQFVAISRRVLYLQALLITCVSLVLFSLGYLAGRGGRGPQEDPASLKPAEVQGSVAFQGDDGQPHPDQQAVVILFPKGVRPPQKIPVEGLRPDDAPNAEHNNLRAVESSEGVYARADDAGRFDFRVRPGVYQVLVISKHARRPAGSEPKSKDLIALGGYFQPAPDLIGPYRYEYSERRLPNDSPLDYKFGR